MCTMLCVKYLLSCCLMVSFVLGVGSIAIYPKEHKDTNIITEEERRGAERLEESRTDPVTEDKTEPRKRGILLSNIYKSPGSLVRPSIALGFDGKEPPGSDLGYDGHHRPSYSIIEGRPPHHQDSGSRLGFPGYYGSYPVEYGGGYGHSGGGLFGHSGGGSYGGGGSYSGGGSYEYPAYGHGGGEVGHQSGFGFKSLKGLLLPLAGIALLGAAAALTANPVLLQLGVVNGRRRRRGLIHGVGNDVYPANIFVKPSKSA